MKNKTVEGNPWDTYPIGENILYRLPLPDYGCEMSLNEDGSARVYHMIFFLLDKNTGKVVAWTDRYVDRTESSEAYYKDALEYGVLEKKEQ